MSKLLLALVVLTAIPAAAMVGPQPGDTAPSVTLPDTAGVNHIIPGDYTGHVLQLVFWMSLNPSCITELQQVQTMYETYGSRGFVPLAINSWEDMDTIKVYARQYTYPFLRDTGTAWSLYDIEGTVPCNYVIDTAGIVVAGMLGYNYEVVESLITPYLIGVAETPAVQPLGFSAVSPSPAVGHSAVSFSLSQATGVSLRVYSTAGMLVRTLVNGRMPAGANKVYWDLRDDAGRPVRSGLYLYKLTAGPQVAQTKVSVLK